MSEHHHPIHDANVAVEHALHLNARRKLRIVAILEIAKGTATLLLATGLLSTAPGVLKTVLLDAISRLRWLPDMGLPEKIEALTHGFDQHRLAFAILVTLYILIRYAEAYGLWRGRNWARWLGLIGVSVYLPLEIREMVVHPGWSAAAVFTFNLLIIWLLWPPERANNPVRPK
jgi:uncharacterized membrane protein (DUF2068 family)